MTRRNQRSAEAEAYRRLYKTARWKRLRLAILSLDPLCRMCAEAGKIRAATVVDHIKPHSGDLALFYAADNLQPLCSHHHDSAKQSEERAGFSKAVGQDGWPTDKRHPVNAWGKT